MKSVRDPPCVRREYALRGLPAGNVGVPDFRLPRRKSGCPRLRDFRDGKVGVPDFGCPRLRPTSATEKWVSPTSARKCRCPRLPTSATEKWVSPTSPKRDCAGGRGFRRDREQSAGRLAYRALGTDRLCGREEAASKKQHRTLTSQNFPTAFRALRRLTWMALAVIIGAMTCARSMLIRHGSAGIFHCMSSCAQRVDAADRTGGEQGKRPQGAVLGGCGGAHWWPATSAPERQLAAFVGPGRKSALPQTSF